MKYIAILISVLLLQSCSHYNTGSMVDDVYYSEIRIQKQGYVDLHDRYLTMKTRGTRWQNFDDDFNYWYLYPNTSLIGWWPNVGFGLGNVYYPSWRWWNYPYMSSFNYPIWRPQPYLTPVLPVKPSTINTNRPRQFNLNTYGNSTNTNSTISVPRNNSPVRQFNNGSGNSPSSSNMAIPRNSAPVRKFN